MQAQRAAAVAAVLGQDVDLQPEAGVPAVTVTRLPSGYDRDVENRFNVLASIDHGEGIVGPGWMTVQIAGHDHLPVVREMQGRPFAQAIIAVFFRGTP